MLFITIKFFVEAKKFIIYNNNFLFNQYKRPNLTEDVFFKKNKNIIHLNIYIYIYYSYIYIGHKFK